MTESELSRLFIKECKNLMLYAVVIKHADRATFGMPDISITWQKTTSWWEVKFYDEKPFRSPTQQETTCQKLASQGYCHYVIYELLQGVKKTFIVSPLRIGRWRSGDNRPGYDHVWLAHFVKHIHLTNRNATMLE